MEKVIIIGSGPAAMTAAIYTARANLEPLVFEGFMAGGIPAGGQLMTTTEIENFPGFPEGMNGPDLMNRMRQQASACGARMETRTVDRVELSQRPFQVICGSQAWQCQSLIVATGATARRLNLPGEDRLWQRGISACAVCDGALPMFRNQPVAVIGGGDSAAEEATHMTKFASKVYVVHRRDELRASQAMQKRLLENPKIEMVWSHIPVEALGETKLDGLKVKSVKDGTERVLTIAGLFYAVGHTPNVGFLDGQLTTDETGYIETLPGSTRTSLPGVFAAGDVQDRFYRQAITAAGSGCMAALEAERFLLENAVDH